MSLWKKPNRRDAADLQNELFRAAEHGNAAKIEALIAEGADVNGKNYAGRTALFDAYTLDCVEALVAGGVDVNAKDNDGTTALMHMAEYGYSRAFQNSASTGRDNKDAVFVRALIAAGADVNAKSNDRTTALMNSAKDGHEDTIRALIAAGADLNAKHNDGRTAQYRGTGYAGDVLRQALQAQNLLRWERSGFPRKWVDDHHGQWGHSDWLDLLEKLKRTDFWPMEPGAIGRVLEEQKKAQPPEDRQPPRGTESASQPAGGLELPPEFDATMSYRDMFRTLTPERLRAICRALPIEQLDLNRPGRPPNAEQMGQAITQVFAVSIYMATGEVAREFGDIVFPRLVSQIAKYKGAELHIELCDLVRDFAIHLTSARRSRDAVQVLNVLKGSLFWHAFPQGNACLFVALTHIADETKLRADYEAALRVAEQIPAGQIDDVLREGIKGLKQRMSASLR